ncbi:leucine-rich repeat domain-containing protein [Leucobacter luti]|uniref:leucine-rich repeat domain-containing protein n=1 Tax=Leucobacter luti TaxID=340320 RepID=UPI0010475CB2|nr:leucine-rich repeat domain-containing protein [Leucobacter luti]MCW2287064.1 hypothetical protein [Leucobacter luti]
MTSLKIQTLTAAALTLGLLAPAAPAFASDPLPGAPIAAPLANISLDEVDPAQIKSVILPEPASVQSPSARTVLPDDNKIVNMPDAALRSAVIAQVGGGSTLTRGALRKLQVLRSPNTGIADLTGLEYASQLDLVDLSRNNITSLEPLRGLSAIRHLNVSSTLITDISAVSTMSEITYLQCNWTDVADIEPLRDKTQLWRIELAGTQVSNLDPVRDLVNMIDLYLEATPVSDISPLRGLVGLYTLSAPDTEISDLRPVAGLPRLQIVNVNGARVSDLSMLDTWPNLQQVGFQNQRVTGFPVVSSRTESTYRTTRAATAPFRMLEDVVLTAGGDATTTAEGLTLWEHIAEDATELTATVSGDPLPGSGATYSALLSYPLTRADFTNGDLPAATVGTAYSFQFTVDSGFEDGPFTLIGGAIPGLELTEDGVLAGTPAEDGTFTLDVRRTDAFGNMIDRSYAVTVAAATVVPPVDPPVTPPVDPPVTTPVVPPVDPPVAPPTSPTISNTLKPTVSGAAALATTGAPSLPVGLTIGFLALLILGGGALALAPKRRNQADGTSE